MVEFHAFALPYVKSFKLHGRDDIDLLMNSLRIIKNFDDDAEILDEVKYQFLNEHGIKGKKKQQWLKKISDCQSQCWNCNVCDVLMEHGRDRQSAPITY
ncbi:MAG: hypothetical protein V3T17_07435 [Pseudomonadales bacterium]